MRSQELKHREKNGGSALLRAEHGNTTEPIRDLGYGHSVRGCYAIESGQEKQSPRILH